MYAKSLSVEALKHYKEKTELFDGLDPFVGGLGKPICHVPPLEAIASDIVSYLVLH